MSYLKSMFFTLSIMLIGTILITIFNYFNVLNGFSLKIIMLFIPVIALFIGGFQMGKTSSKKGYIEGLKYGIIWVLLLLIINLFTKSFDITSIIYYIILLLLSAFAGSLGINRRKN